jgi:hypothetical protein
MAIARGRSTVRSELDLMGQALENMICFNESKFNEEIASIKVQLDDINQKDIPEDERQNLSRMYDYLNDLEKQLFFSRGKLIVAIYSICEATLAEVCKNYHIRLRHKPMPKRQECNSKSDYIQKNRDYYLFDYLYSIDSKACSKDACIVSSVIREIRNYFTHSSFNREKLDKIERLLNKHRITGVERQNDTLCVTSVEGLKEILQHCNSMLIEYEELARNQLKNNTIL